MWYARYWLPALGLALIVGLIIWRIAANTPPAVDEPRGQFLQKQELPRR